RNHPRAVFRVARLRKQNRLAIGIWLPAIAVGEEILGKFLPQRAVQPVEQVFLAGDDQQPFPRQKRLSGYLGQDTFDRLLGGKVEPDLQVSPPAWWRRTDRSGARHNRSRPSPRSDPACRPRPCPRYRGAPTAYHLQRS